ncbi:MAG: efflux RND transporter permease subunit [Lentisphaerales bacterium]|nr:efflux RND transporter permease subunit [Lentisphaerales bacterium]
MSGLINWAARHPVFSNIVTILIFFVGVMVIPDIKREYIPNFTQEDVVVTGDYPGASAKEIEETVAIVIENALQGTDNLERIRSYVYEGKFQIHADLLKKLDEGEKRRSYEIIRQKIEQIPRFPEEVENLRIYQDRVKDPVFIFVLYGDIDQMNLHRFANDLVKDLQMAGISDVQLRAAKKYELSIQLDEAKMRQWSISYADIRSQIEKFSTQKSLGTLVNSDQSMRLEVRGRSKTRREFQNLPIQLNNGQIIKLSELASISDGFKLGKEEGIFKGKPALEVHIRLPDKELDKSLNKRLQKMLGNYQVSITPNDPKAKEKILKTLDEKYSDINYSSNEKTITASLPLYSGIPFSEMIVGKQNNTPLRMTDIAIVNENFAHMQDAPHNLKLQLLYSTNQMVSEGLEVLRNNALQGFLLVFIVLCLFLNTKLAFWVAIGLPFSCAVCAITMWYFGASLNMISLFGIVLVLGIVVDDAIVIGENIHKHRMLGKSPLRAAIDGTCEVGTAVTSAVITTIIAFLPLFYVDGDVGQLAYFIPLAVISTLAASLFEGLFILPSHLSNVREKEFAPLKKIQDLIQKALKFIISNIYQPLYVLSLRCRYISVATALLLFALAIIAHEREWLSGNSETEKDEILLFVDLKLHQSSTHKANKAVCTFLEEKAREAAEELANSSGAPVLKGVFTHCGYGEGGEHVSQMVAILYNTKVRRVHSNKFLQLWRQKVGTVLQAQKLDFMTAGFGGSSSSSFKMHLTGENLEAMEDLSLKMNHKLSNIPGVLESVRDVDAGKKSLILTLTPQARLAGFTEEYLAEKIKSALYGSNIQYLQIQQQDVPVNLRTTMSQANFQKILAYKVISPKSNAEYELGELIKFEESYAIDKIQRIDGRRFILIKADLDESSITRQQLIASIEQEFKDMIKPFPDVELHFKGLHSSVEESMTSIYISAAAAILAIYFIIVFTFHSYLQPLIILFTVPLGFIGAVAGHYFLRVSFELFSLIGIVALSGVVVNDAIVLIDSVNKRLQKGMSVKDSLIEAGPGRFQAIVLTTLTTVLALVPLIREKVIMAKGLVPMSVSLTGGLIFATVLTLFIVPCLFFILNDLRRFCRFLVSGRFPSAEEVEPASPKLPDIPQEEIILEGAEA